MIFLRYGLVAGVAYGIDLGGFILLLSYGLSPLTSNIIIKLVAAIFGFFSHRYFTYSIKNFNEIKKEAIRYFSLAIFYTPTSSIFLYGIMQIVKNPIYAKAISDISLFILMYWITSNFAFSRNKK